MGEKERFEKAMIEGGFEAPVRGQHGGYLYAEDAKAWGAWQLAVAAKPPDILFDGFTVLQALNENARKRTSPENVSDVLDAVVRIMRSNVEVRGASPLAGEASSAEGATSTVVLGAARPGKD